MAFLGTPQQWVGFVGSLLLVSLGLFVASVKPRRAVNGAFAILALTWGARGVAYSLWEAPDARQAFVDQRLAPALVLVAVVAVALLAYLFPRPLARSERRLALVPPAVFALGLVFVVVANRGDALDVVRRPWTHDSRLLDFAYISVGALLALRWRRLAGPAEARDRRQVALVGAALVLAPAYVSGLQLESALLSGNLGRLILLAILLVLWLWNAAHAREPRVARNVALSIPAFGLIGAAASAATQEVPFVGVGLRATAFAAAPVILGYALLKHQLFDIDVRLHKTVRASTLAAVFIAVVFIASSLAQVAFQDSIGPYLGAGAAGLLLFALAPLQRAAERVAERAVPLQGRDEGERKRALYRSALAMAWEDGRITPAEARHLADLRGMLALPATEYDALEAEWHGART